MAWRASGPGACSGPRSTMCCRSRHDLHGRPIDDDADAPSVAISKLGQAVVAYRQSAGPGSPLPGPRIFLNTLPDGESSSGAEFLGASIADNQVGGRRRGRASGRRASTSTKA